jgi:hypothetical protein
MDYIALPHAMRHNTQGKPCDFYAIPTTRKHRTRGANSYGEPQDYIAGVPPYFKVTGVDPQGKLILKELARGSHESMSVEKWVAKGSSRLLLNEPSQKDKVNPPTRGIVLEHEIKQYFAKNQQK